MAISETIASSFSPYRLRLPRTVWAIPQVATLARKATPAPASSGLRRTRLGARHAGHQRGEDEHRLQPLPEDDHRRVRDDREVGGRPCADRLLGVRERDVERRARLGHLGRVGLALHELREARQPVGAVPEEALDLDEEAVGEPAQPLLRAELEEGIGLEPSLLGLRELAGGHRVLEPVERGRDDVEVGGRARVLPLLRVERVDEAERLVGRGLDVVRVGDRVVPRRGAEVGREPVEKVAEPPRVLLVLEREQVLEVAERLRGAVAERHRLLDLEVERDLAVLHAALVLDRDEGEEAHELPGAAQLLLLGERRGAEALERRVDLGLGRLDAGVVPRLRGRDELLERVRSRCRASARERCFA